MSITLGQFCRITIGYPIEDVQTVFETRRTRLRMLIEKYGHISKLNQAIGWEPTNARLSQIQNRSLRSGRDTPYEMGDVTARMMEEKLALPVGWMDTPPTFSELHGNDQLATAVHLMEAMPPWQVEQAVKILAALAELPKKNGTTDQ